MFADATIRTLLTATVIAATAFWAVPASGDPDPSEPSHKPPWWNNPNGTTVKQGFKFDDDSIKPDAEPDVRPPWCDQPSGLSHYDDMDWFGEMGGRTGVWGLPKSKDGQSGELIIWVDNGQADVLVKELFV